MSLASVAQSSSACGVRGVRGARAQIVSAAVRRDEMRVSMERLAAELAGAQERARRLSTAVGMHDAIVQVRAVVGGTHLRTLDLL